jgi:hypothetical protein
VRLPGAEHREALRVEDAQLGEDRGLLAVDVLRRDLPILEVDDADVRHLEAAPGRVDSWGRTSPPSAVSCQPLDAAEDPTKEGRGQACHQ